MYLEGLGSFQIKRDFINFAMLFLMFCIKPQPLNNIMGTPLSIITDSDWEEEMVQ